jgi:hypothetical protein
MAPAHGVTFLAAPTASLGLAVFYFSRLAIVSQLIQLLVDGSTLLEQERDGLLAQLFGLIQDAHEFLLVRRQTETSALITLVQSSRVWV